MISTWVSAVRERGGHAEQRRTRQVQIDTVRFLSLSVQFKANAGRNKLSVYQTETLFQELSYLVKSLRTLEALDRARPFVMHKLPQIEPGQAIHNRADNTHCA